MANITPEQLEAIRSAVGSGKQLFKPFNDLAEQLDGIQQLVGYAAELQSSVAMLVQSRQSAQDAADVASTNAATLTAKLASDLDAAKAANQIALDQFARDLAASQSNYAERVASLQSSLAQAQARYDAESANAKSVADAVVAEAHNQIAQAQADAKSYADKLAKAKAQYEAFLADLSK